MPIQAVVVREVDDEGKVIEAGGADGASRTTTGRRVRLRKRGEEKDGVFVVQDRKAFFTPVKTGIMGDTEIEILEGLEEGQEIVTGSYRTLRQLENEARIKVEKKKRESKS